MRYGLPYMGSKNKIAERIINLLPNATNFYDLFAGGCAITHAAILSSKYKNIIFNDIVGDITQLFLDAINYKFKEEKRWISREDFFELRNQEPYIKYNWSFGDKGNTYLYGKNIEEFKKAYWLALFENNFEFLEKLGIHLEIKASEFLTRKNEFKNKIKSLNLPYPSPERLVSLERLERLKELQGINTHHKLIRLNLSYDEVIIEKDSVVYCDIPYENTAEYEIGSFNHKQFYNWACKQNELVVISSYNINDERFILLESYDKLNTLSRKTNSMILEKLFIPKKQVDLWNKRKILTKEKIKQLSIFDL